jgi:tRNA-specific 2-thiouridylase
VKFPVLYRTMAELGGAALATGHYAQIERSGDRALLKKGRDTAKDQSYMLYSLSQEILRHTLLPLGQYTKQEIRALAEERELANARKVDSQDICFVPDGDYLSFLERFTGEKSQPGPFLNSAGEQIGTHRGYMGYTIGQRKGLGVSAAHRLYVYEKDPKTNVVRLGEERRIFSQDVEVERANLIAVDSIPAPMELRARVRYHHAEAPCTVEQTGSDTLHVRFHRPQRSVVPGQSLVLYDGEYVVGGGIIL